MKEPTDAQSQRRKEGLDSEDNREANLEGACCTLRALKKGAAQ